MIANRMDWVDWAKTIAITLVVFGHLRSDFMSYIFSFHLRDVRHLCLGKAHRLPLRHGYTAPALPLSTSLRADFR